MREKIFLPQFFEAGEKSPITKYFYTSMGIEILKTPKGEYGWERFIGMLPKGWYSYKDDFLSLQTEIRNNNGQKVFVSYYAAGIFGAENFLIK